MKQKKMKIVTGVMLAVVLFTSSLALLMYSKQSQLREFIEKQVEVYVATKSLSIGDKITAKDITISSLPQSYLSFTPLTQAEIVGRYASVEIFINEPFRPEKLSLKKPDEKAMQAVIVPELKEDVELKQLSTDSISIPMSVFKNLDHSLKSGEFIDIVAVLPKKNKKNDYQFTTKYIALHVPIRSFVSNTRLIDKMMTKVYDNKSKEVNILLADTVVLEMTPKDIKNFFPMYYKTQELNAQRVHTTKENRGHLWMVRCSSKIDEKLEKQKRRMLVDARVTARKKRAVQKVSISYED